MTSRRDVLAGLAAVPITAALPPWTSAGSRTDPELAAALRARLIDPAFPYTKAEMAQMTAAARELVWTVSLFPDTFMRDWWLMVSSNPNHPAARAYGEWPLPKLSYPKDAPTAADLLRGQLKAQPPEPTS